MQYLVIYIAYEVITLISQEKYALLHYIHPSTFSPFPGPSCQLKFASEVSGFQLYSWSQYFVVPGWCEYILWSDIGF